MLLKDSLIAGVTRNKFNELVFKVKVKAEDYKKEDYETLHNAWQEGITKDVTVGDAESSTQPINQETGEILDSHQASL